MFIVMKLRGLENDGSGDELEARLHRGCIGEPLYCFDKNMLIL